MKKPETVVQNGVNADWLELDMDDEWMDMETIACVFVNRYVEESEEKEVAKELPLVFGERICVPWECLVNEGMLSVSCTGYIGGEKIMTTMYPDSFWKVVQSGPMSGEAPLGPTEWPGWDELKANI